MLKTLSKITFKRTLNLTKQTLDGKTHSTFKSCTSNTKGSFAWEKRLRRGPNCKQP